jgi:hypothetical protein
VQVTPAASQGLQVNELEALIKEWIKLRDKFGQGDDYAVFRLVEIEKKLQDQYNIVEPVKWLLEEEKKIEMRICSAKRKLPSVKTCKVTIAGQRSSGVEQRFRKPPVKSSTLFAGSIRLLH